MAYVIYDKNTSRIVGKTYKTSAAVKAAMTRLHNKWFDTPKDQRGPNPYTIYATLEYNLYMDFVSKKIERVNLMTGEKYLEDVNTPNFLSPASETYWSM